MYQISLKSVDFRLRYSDEAIFKMAAVRHLQFYKFGILVIWPLLERDSALSYKISRKSDNRSLRCSTYRNILVYCITQCVMYYIMCITCSCIMSWLGAPVLQFLYCNPTKDDFQYGSRPWKPNLHLYTKFRWNRMISGWGIWDIAIKLFSKWRPCAILNFRNSVFWSYGLC